MMVGKTEVKVLARRNPPLKYLWRGSFQLRVADRNLSGPSYHEPPRCAREPSELGSLTPRNSAPPYLSSYFEAVHSQTLPCMPCNPQALAGN